jgi:hypothetical protein
VAQPALLSRRIDRQRLRRGRRLSERLAHAVAGNGSVGMAVGRADKLATVAVAEVQSDDMQREPQHVERVPAEVVPVAV